MRRARRAEFAAAMKRWEAAEQGRSLDLASTLASPSRLQKPGQRMFEYVVNVGMVYSREESGELVLQSKPAILFHYPMSSPPSIPLLEEMCFPEGVKCRALRRSPSESDLCAALLGQVHLRSLSEHSFVILVTREDGSCLYGCCMRRDDVVLSECSDFESVDTMHVASSVLVILSARPCLDVHFGVLRSLLLSERVERGKAARGSSVSRSLGFREVEPASPAEGSSMYLHALSVVPASPSVWAAPSLREYASWQWPASGDALVGLLSDEEGVGSTSLQEAEAMIGDDFDMISSWTLPRAARALPLRQLLIYFSVLLLEPSIAVVASSLGSLTAIVLAMQPMLRPLEWTGALITALPHMLIDVLDSPVSVLVGVPGRYRDEVQARVMDDVEIVVVDVDEGTISLPPKLVRPPQKLLDELVAACTPYYSVLTSLDVAGSLDISVEAKAAAREMAKVLAQVVQKLLRKIKPNLRRDSSGSIQLRSSNSLSAYEQQVATSQMAVSYFSKKFPRATVTVDSAPRRRRKYKQDAPS